ncbi:MAG: alpha/beta hydrolase [Rickettsia endosymbiont of Gnoriste bilineata]|nr:alpha/beta hydrolase [Rickettsia endosymbiont of Platyusa sonomae]MCC8416460.1 alpha/beta hydrolase [Rickettsia endosymbiont of Gnoriste bilineata]
MEKIYNTEKKKFITYNHYKSNKKNMPHVMFLHGLMSNMNGTKAVFLENYCKKHDYNFITFDNFGHGNSSGNFLDETIGSWLTGVELVLNKLIIQPTIIIGSSMGAWLAILAAIKFPSKICGLIALAPALDFTETIWNNLTEIQKIQMQQQKWLEFNGRDCNGKYPISYQLIFEARNHLLLNSNSINLKKPVHLIHGILDTDVPYTISSKLVEKITSDIVVMKLIKDGHHNLSRESDLAIIANSLEEIIKYKN